MPILFGRRNLGYVVGQRCSPLVWKSDPVPMRAAGFPTLAFLQQQSSAGFKWQQSFAKATAGVSTMQWFDMWPCAGDPPAGAYAGAAFTAVQFSDTTTGALQHGGNVSPSFKSVTYFAANLSTALTNTILILYDRVLTYEACTFNANVLQAMTNTLAAQRYNGAGLPGLQISMTAGTVGAGATASLLTQLAYTNQAGTAAVAAPLSTPSPNIATSYSLAGTLGAECICPFDPGASSTHPFLYLAPGDTGVRKIESYTTSAANTGNFVFVLCRPLAYLMVSTTQTEFETDLINQVFGLERVYDGACLSLLAYNGTNSNTSNFTGRIETLWG